MGWDSRTNSIAPPLDVPCGADRQTGLDEIVMRLSNANDTLRQKILLLERAADRALGCEPTCGSKQGEDPEVPGKAFAALQGLSALESLLSDLGVQILRIEKVM